MNERVIWRDLRNRRMGSPAAAVAYECARVAYEVGSMPDGHPLDPEVEDTLDANPGLEEELDEMEQLHQQGELELVEHDEVVARLRRLGVPLGDDEPIDPRQRS